MPIRRVRVAPLAATVTQGTPSARVACSAAAGPNNKEFMRLPGGADRLCRCHAAHVPMAEEVFRPVPAIGRWSEFGEAVGMGNSTSTA